LCKKSEFDLTLLPLELATKTGLGLEGITRGKSSFGFLLDF
jgi:hypothetical protein